MSDLSPENLAFLELIGQVIPEPAAPKAAPKPVTPAADTTEGAN
jgi:hypothetical protein